ncbi:MAG: 30S ribosome-binding factor RbfA [Longimicrobiales bacterium]|nr:30S ribosome-binding factor RbfA [Longimicrobiales bacterium]
MTRRLERLNEQLRREIATRLRREVRDPRVGRVTVTGVRVSPDLAQARVLVRLGGGVEDRDKALAGLTAAGPFLRRALGAELHIRRAPELHFIEDHQLEKAMRIDALLDEVRPAGGWDADDESTMIDEEDDASEKDESGA